MAIYSGVTLMYYVTTHTHTYINFNIRFTFMKLRCPSRYACGSVKGGGHKGGAALLLSSDQFGHYVPEDRGNGFSSRCWN